MIAWYNEVIINHKEDIQNDNRNEEHPLDENPLR